jgi:hypothetical protein
MWQTKETKNHEVLNLGFAAGHLQRQPQQLDGGQPRHGGRGQGHPGVDFMEISFGRKVFFTFFVVKLFTQIRP